VITALALLFGLVIAALILRDLAALIYTRTPQYQYEKRLKRYL
jgi:hypothetical protein